jgi:soluble lytic murein transglycosylase
MKNISPKYIFAIVLFLYALVPFSDLGADSTSAEEEFKKALTLYKEKKYPQALTVFKKLENEPSKNLRSEALFMQGQALRVMEKWSEAELIFSRVAESFSDLADYARYYQGEALRMRGENGKALQVFQDLVISHPQSLLISKTQLQMAQILLEKGDAPEAASLCERVIQRNEKMDLTAEALYLLAQTKENMAAYAEAAKLYRRIWLQHPLHPKAKTSQVKYEALQKDKKVPEVKIPPQDLFRRTQILYQARLYETAFREMEKIGGFPTETYPANYVGEPWVGEFYFQRGIISFRLKKYAQAAETLHLVIKNERQGGIAEKAFYWRCRTLQRMGQGEEALNAAASFPKTFPSGTYGDRILELKAQVLEERGNIGEAISAYQEMVQKFPQSPLVLPSLWKGGWLLYQKQDWEGAIRTWQILQAYKTVSPWSEKALYWKAKALGKMGQTDMAEETFQRFRLNFPAAYYTQLSLGGGTSPRPEKGFRPIKDLALAPFVKTTDLSAETKDVRLKKGTLLVRLLLFAEAVDELEAAEGNGMGEEMRLEISRLLREMGEYHRSTLLVRRNFSIRPLPPSPSARDHSLYLLAYPLGNPLWINKYAELQNLDPALLSAVILEESRFDPQALSVSGARGLMQIMPGTGKEIAKKLKIRAYGDQNLYEPEFNIRFGSWYLARLLEEFGGKFYLAVAAYNAGPRAVREWLAKFSDLAEDEFVEKIPYLETRNYVVRVLTSYQVYRALYPSGEN